MSVPEQVPYKEYRATGSSNTFEITFYLPDPKDLVVMVNKEIPLVGAYSIVGDSVVFSTPPNEGDLVELTRDTQLDRETNFKSYDNSFRPETINFDLDKIWLVLQESNLVDAKILARLKQEIEWRRTHDFNYDELAQVREKQLFDALKGYTDTLLASTNPGVFQGVIAGVVFARDGKSIQTHLEEILDTLVENREDIDSKAEQKYVDEQLNSKANLSDVYLKNQTYNKTETYSKAEVDNSFSAYAGGRKGYTTLALAQADQANLSANSVVDVTNDPTASNNGSYQWNGTTLTKSAYDPLTQAKNHTQEFVIDKLYNGFNKVIGSEIALNANYTTATVTIAFAEPVGGDGHLSEINVAANRDGDLTILVLNKVGSDLIVEQSISLSVSASNVNYQLSEIIPVKSGQYIGFQSQDNFIKSLRDGGTYKATYPANGIVSSIPAIQSFNTISWQINFAIKRTAIVPQLENLQQTGEKLSVDVGWLQEVVFNGGVSKIGVDSLTISSSTASKNYIPLASPITVDGKLTQVQLATTVASTVNFFTMKSIGGASFEVSRESSSFNVLAGISTIQLETPLQVEVGEYIGWYSSNNAVCFVAGQNQTPYISGDRVGNIFTSDGVFAVSQPQIQFNIRGGNLLSSKVLTQADYDALVIKDSQTLYFVVD